MCLYFSATWPQGVRRLAQSYMKNPIQVFVGSLDLAAVHTVTQTIIIVEEEEKTSLVNIMKNFSNYALKLKFFSITILLLFFFVFNRCINFSKV